MIENTPHNCASRLLETAEYIAKADKNTTVWQAIASLVTDTTDKQTAFSVASELSKLAHNIETIILDYHVGHTRLIHSVRPLLRGYQTLKLDGALHASPDLYRETSIVALAAFSTMFESIDSENELNPEKITELYKTLQEVESDVNNLEDTELREILTSILHTAESALKLYNINGVKAFSETYELSIGKLILHYQKSDEPSPKNKKVIDKVFGFTHTLGQVASAANALLTLPSKGSELLKLFS